jgi:TetR/AcrR family transcriptional regulator of autoinduction and epiphytic fitness
MPTANPADRRAALKARHRRAILDAAGELITERGAPRFSVDELAQRADVSRRTIFNHFDSIDDVVLSACTEVLQVIVDSFRDAAAATAIGDGSRSAMFDEIAHTLRTVDLPGGIAYLGRALAGASEARQHQFVQEAFTRVGGHLTLEVARRNSSADLLDVELLVTSLMHGVSVIAKHWIAATAGSVTGDARVMWDRLLDRLLASIRTGYMPER